MDLKYALGDQLGGGELEEAAPYTQWPRLLRQILGASVLVSIVLIISWVFLTDPVSTKLLVILSKKPGTGCNVWLFSFEFLFFYPKKKAMCARC